MRYNEAAFIGQQRSRAAQMKLFDYAGFAMLTYTIKKSPKDNGFLPVGEDLLVSKAIYDNNIIIYLTDEEGYAKAQTKPMGISEWVGYCTGFEMKRAQEKDDVRHGRSSYFPSPTRCGVSRS